MEEVSLAVIAAGVALTDEVVGSVPARNHLQCHHVPRLAVLQRAEVVRETEQVTIGLPGEVEPPDLARPVGGIEDHQIRGGVLAMRTIIQVAAEKRDEIRGLTSAARARAIQAGTTGGDPVVLEYELASRGTEPVWMPDSTASLGYTLRDVPVYLQWNTTRTTTRPVGYVLPPSMAHVVPRLLDHDIAVYRFRAPATLDAITETRPLADAPALATDILGLVAADVLEASWLDNGPPWLALRLRSAEEVLAVRPRYGRFGELDHLGVVAAPGTDGTDIEVRGFTTVGEDPVTGSLNAGLARWLTGTGVVSAPYVAAQGTALGRTGRVHVTAADGQLWIGGATTTAISGTVRL